jgi:hypothetical protein
MRMRNPPRGVRPASHAAGGAPVIAILPRVSDVPLRTLQVRSEGEDASAPERSAVCAVQGVTVSYDGVAGVRDVFS